MAKLVIVKWYGRLGNNITQLTNAILFAIHKNVKVIYIPKHSLINTTEIKLNDVYKTNNVSYNHTFFSRKAICETFNIKEDIFKMTDKVCLLLKQIFIFKYDDPYNITDDDLTIHLRSGDVYNTNPHSGWVQPPLSYYNHIIGLRKWRKIIIVCEDTKPPVLNELLKHKNVIFKVQSLENDISIILNSKNVCFGMGSFVPSLLLFSKLKTIYYPTYCYRYLIDYICCENVICHDLYDYIPKGQWKNTLAQREIMMTYVLPENNL